MIPLKINYKNVSIELKRKSLNNYLQCIKIPREEKFQQLHKLQNSI